MTTIQKEGNKLEPDSYLELFEIDSTPLGLTEVFYFTNVNTPNNSGILWRTHTYQSFPLKLTGAGNSGDATAPPRPQLSVSNVNKTLMIAIYALGDLRGMLIRRWRTFYKFTDNGSEPNFDAHFPVDEWYITKKVIQNKHVMTFELSSPLDRPGLKLPRRVILRDQGFPGVSRVRFRG